MNNPAPRPSRRIALALTAQQAEDLRLLWREHSAPLQAMLRRWCRDDADAADALQELFLRLARAPHLVLTAENPRALLVVTARRIAIDADRRRQAGERREEQLANSGTLTELGGDARSDADLRAAIARAVRALAPDQRRVFEARFFQGLTLADIAKAQDISINTAASRFRYALDKIRAELRPYYDDMNKTQATSPVSTPASAPVAAEQSRLIRALEPKRVPSLAPGLEGLAALAPDDAHFEPQVIDESFLPEVSNCDGLAGEQIAIDEPFITDKVGEFGLPDSLQEWLEGQEHILEAVPSEGLWLDQIDPQIFICWVFDGFDNIGEGVPELAVCDFGTIELEEVNVDDYFTFGGIEEVTDGEEFSGEEFQPPTAEELFKHYQSFLADNPDWLSENGIGEIQAQVITSSSYFKELELPNPGAAKAFDLWYEFHYARAEHAGFVINDGEALDKVASDEMAYFTMGSIQPNFRGEMTFEGDSAEALSEAAPLATGTESLISLSAAHANGTVGQETTASFTEFETITLDIPSSAVGSVAGLATEPEAVRGFVFTNPAFETQPVVTANLAVGDNSSAVAAPPFMPGQQVAAGAEAALRQDTVAVGAQPEAATGLPAAGFTGHTPQTVATQAALVAGIGAMVAPTSPNKRIPSATH